MKCLLHPFSKLHEVQTLKVTVPQCLQFNTCKNCAYRLILQVYTSM